MKTKSRITRTEKLKVIRSLDKGQIKTAKQISDDTALELQVVKKILSVFTGASLAGGVLYKTTCPATGEVAYKQ